MDFGMKKPCKNCPFRAEGAITLQEGRVAGIVEDLKDDFKVFHCHKTVHSSKGGDWIEDESGEDFYLPSGNEKACIGALAYMWRMGYLPILARLAIRSGELSKEILEKQYSILIQEGGAK